MKTLNYIFVSLLLFFAPINGLLIAVGVSIALDTFTGVFKSVRINGWCSIRSRKLSELVSKMLLYEVCILLLFPIDHYLLNEFTLMLFGFKYMFTKICSIVLILIEFISIKENIEEAMKIKIWVMLKNLLKRTKEIKTDINEITG